MSVSAHHKLLQSAPRPERKTLKSERTRDAILNAAVEFVCDHSFHDLTVGELMEHAGSSRSAFYLYFDDLYQLMETLLLGLQKDIFEVATPWFHGEGEPVPLLEQSLKGLVDVCHGLGPVLRAVSDAAASDDRMAKSYAKFLGSFDDAVAARIEQHQQAGLIPRFEARPVAIALNRMDAGLMIHAFGRRPGSEKKPVLDAIMRIWESTLYKKRKQKLQVNHTDQKETAKENA